jgi:DNA-binding GntR family transcriptional regulator
VIASAESQRANTYSTLGSEFQVCFIMPSTPKKKSRAESIRKRLEEEIFLGIVKPGQRLDEQAEARRFGASRTPVREAISYLASSGLVKVESRRGATVTKLTVPQIVEMMDVLAHLEDLCGGLAARNMNSKELSALKEAHQACVSRVKAGKIDEYYREAKKFHEIIYHASRNTFLAETCANLRNRVFPYLRYQLHRPGRVETCLSEQQLIADAILARNPEAAAHSSREHLRVQQRVFSEFIKALENTGMAAAQFDWVPQKISQLWAARE